MSDGGDDPYRQTIHGHDGYGASRQMVVLIPREGEPDQVALIIKDGRAILGGIAIGRGGLLQLMSMLGRAEWRIFTGKYWKPPRRLFR